MHTNVGTPSNEKEPNRRTQDEFHPTFACLLHADSYDHPSHDRSISSAISD
ncbi:hypothetical protein BIFPSEUDO_04392 [Bifidobacterium pseudocatenulatum DSM 20438 = JCM 1200 = LMG 10505]|uniref:Uncharacterized protein n=1 Tax=Bifidobacterium pseudocatenulatum DSM 20438 = JCM 1200 = LMG 10505 TaxID=547043 RepID=C0BVE7_BIFPS|nr:hypothetical protein BIFPSEUDO_04392 [Bifidobacterium pseudocatenulatum DSM 20438 = JCM 1200 = LMG 10505]